MLIKEEKALTHQNAMPNMGEQDSSRSNNDHNNPGRWNGGRGPSSRSHSGGRGKGNYKKNNNNNSKNNSNNKNDANANNGSTTSQSKIKHSTKDFKGRTKELESFCCDAAMSNQADVCTLTAESVTDHCGESSQMGPNVATSSQNLEMVEMKQKLSRPNRPTKEEIDREPALLTECQFSHDDH